MVVNKPSVLIYVSSPDQDLLKEVLAGIEEEGVPFEVKEQEGDLDALACKAAAESVLGSGIGMTGNRLAMQMAGLPKGKNVFELISPGFAQCRNLGANSARAVKKLPFKEICF